MVDVSEVAWGDRMTLDGSTAVMRVAEVDVTGGRVRLADAGWVTADRVEPAPAESRATSWQSLVDISEFIGPRVHVERRQLR